MTTKAIAYILPHKTTRTFPLCSCDNMMHETISVTWCASAPAFFVFNGRTIKLKYAHIQKLQP